MFKRLPVNEYQQSRLQICFSVTAILWHIVIDACQELCLVELNWYSSTPHLYKGIFMSYQFRFNYSVYRNI